MTKLQDFKLKTSSMRVHKSVFEMMGRKELLEFTEQYVLEVNNLIDKSIRTGDYESFNEVMILTGDINKIQVNRGVTAKLFYQELINTQSGLVDKYSEVGYTYLMFCEKANLYKIGFTYNLKERLYAIDSNSPFPVKLELIIRTSYPRGIEKMFQIIHSKQNYRREWFKFSDRQAEKIKNQYNLLQSQYLNGLKSTQEVNK